MSAERMMLPGSVWSSCEVETLFSEDGADGKNDERAVMQLSRDCPFLVLRSPFMIQDASDGVNRPNDYDVLAIQVLVHETLGFVQAYRWEIEGDASTNRPPRFTEALCP